MLQRTFATALILFASTAAQAQLTSTIWTEDFESVTLMPSPQEAPVPPVPVWTETPPAGWTVDNSGVPGQGDPLQGVEDWEGWAFVDEAFWVQADDQRRSEFRDGFGEGVVAVADPDEWDDNGSPADELGFFNAFLTTPAIDVSGVSTLGISFASSWRDEAFDDGDLHSPDGNNQTAVLSVSFDGGDFSQILRWESDQASEFFKDDAPNEMIDLVVGSTGGASTAAFQFALVDGGNDWWWAIDNVSVGEAVPEPATGLMGLLGAIALGLAARRRRG